MTTCIQRPKLSDFGFTTDDSSVFYRPQWSKLPLLVLAIYRVVVSLYVIGFFIGVLVLSIKSQGGASFVYLTTIAFMIFIAYNVTASVNVIWDGCIKRRNAGEELCVRHKTHWFLFSMTTNLNFLVTLVYWSALYTPMLPLIYDLTMHTLTSVVCLLDIFLTPVPIYLLHFVYPLLLGTIYLVFTLIFWAVGGFHRQPIYPFLDYTDHPGRAAGAIVGIFAAVVLMQGAVWALYKFKQWIWVRCDGGTSAPTRLRTLSAAEVEEHCIEDEKVVDEPITTGQI
ncbi:protein rolling stone-like [Patiria miniata]|uniref:Uncharacterized protein n=1 Tax=Patiria miniata TaxID=46514 RepID=A0A913ZWX3_PATMI|nr:protein rolling stone-like [Patiria miniata]XP_038056168.1 protein rolling stone-like [Patiria miniata]XP_038056177.1 protein rolling stone-like [Patiria miniata]